MNVKASTNQFHWTVIGRETSCNAKSLNDLDGWAKSWKTRVIYLDWKICHFLENVVHIPRKPQRKCIIAETFALESEKQEKWIKIGKLAVSSDRCLLVEGGQSAQTTRDHNSELNKWYYSGLEKILENCVLFHRKLSYITHSVLTQLINYLGTTSL